MRALVVFESMFGNTKEIAKAVADGLTSRMDVDLVEVGAAPATIGDDVDLLVVGGPTHAFGMSRQSTRQSAAAQAEGRLVSEGIGLREWLDALRRRSPSVAAVAFDTRVKKPFLPGSAARGAQKRLRQLGFRARRGRELLRGRHALFWTESRSAPAAGPKDWGPSSRRHIKEGSDECGQPIAGRHLPQRGRPGNARRGAAHHPRHPAPARSRPGPAQPERHQRPGDRRGTRRRAGAVRLGAPAAERRGGRHRGRHPPAGRLCR